MDHYLGRRVDAWPETRLHLQAVLDDVRERPLHRLTGTEMIPSLDGLKDFLGRNDRVWYVAVPGIHEKTLDAEASRYLRANMDVVYESSNCLVLLKGGSYRTVKQQISDEAGLAQAQANYLK